MSSKTVETSKVDNKIFCECGCWRTRDRYDKRGRERRFISGHNGRGKGKGITLHSAGYVQVRTEGHPRASKHHYVFEHILVMEKFLGRYPEPWEVDHHRDENRQNNDIKNLQLMIRAEHSRFHLKGILVSLRITS